MSVTAFVPAIWSENLLLNLNQRYVGVANCSRDFEGDIKECGSVVKITKLEDVSIYDYNKNSDMLTPDELNDLARELKIDQAKYFNFQIDDVDRAQAKPGLMEAAMRNAANALAKAADTYVYRLAPYASTVFTHSNVDETNIINHILRARTELFKNGVCDPSDIVIEVTPEMAELILKAKANLIMSSDVLETGYLGSIAGSKIYVSNNIAKEPEGTGETFHKCFVRSKRAITFAEQLSEIEAYRPEQRFADAVKGLHLYGAKVVFPNEFVLLDLAPVVEGQN